MKILVYRMNKIWKNWTENKLKEFEILSPQNISEQQLLQFIT